MKLSELQINEGLVDATTLVTLAKVVKDGLTNGAEVVVLARSIMAIQSGEINSTSSFNTLFNEFFPNKELIDSLKALSKEVVQQLASFVLSLLEKKDVQFVSQEQLAALRDYIYHMTRAGAND